VLKIFNRKLLITFIKSQLASIVATGVDFGVLIFLVQALHIWYVTATAIGAFLGAVTHFTLGRYWSFNAADRPVGGQAVRYALVASTSLLLNTGGVYLLTEYGKIPYWLSNVISGFILGIGFNFFMHRFFVFRENEK
jgi:putative flippase GtrA